MKILQIYSAKDYINIEEYFNCLITIILENNTNDNEPEKYILDKQQHKKKFWKKC